MVVLDLYQLQSEQALDNAVSTFAPTNVVARLPLWSTQDCDHQERTRFGAVRHNRTRRLARKVMQTRRQEQEQLQPDQETTTATSKTNGDVDDEDPCRLRIDHNPLVDGSVEDPWSEAIAVLDAGLLISSNILYRIFCEPGGSSRPSSSVIFYLVWKLLDWKEIPKCYGRYTLCRRSSEEAQPCLTEMTPTELISHVFSLRLINCGMENMAVDEEVMSQVGPPKLAILAGRPDPILLLPFHTGGGLLSYQKDSQQQLSTTDLGQKNEGKTRFVHTLNSPSGWSRKLFSLGLNESDYMP